MNSDAIMKERGFTIIEVIVAVVIFSVVMLCSMSFFSFGNNIMRRAREQTCALQIARNEILTSKTACISTCWPFNVEWTRPVIHYHTIPDLNLIFCSELDWEHVDGNFGAPVNTYADWYRVVTVTVTWNSSIDNVRNNVSLHTMVAISPYHS